MINKLQITNQEFLLISKLIYDKFGIHLTEQKRTLIVERLQKILRFGNFANFQDYYDYVIRDTSGQALLQLIDRISTNHTYFFREKEHFEFLLSTVLPQLVEQHQLNRELRIWCAGCSSGEEAYTLAMILHEFFREEVNKWKIGILATDISTTVLEKANAGIYNENQLDEMPVIYKHRYFRNMGDGNWTVKKLVKDLIMFRRLNLMNPDFPFKQQFQVILCRNVMIYFDNLTRQSLVKRFHRFLEQGGYFFVGHSETLVRPNIYYKYLKPAVYQKI